MVVKFIALEPMRFKTPRGDGEFVIPDEWWEFTQPQRVREKHERYFPYSQGAENIEIVKLSDIEPLKRDQGFELFKKYKLVPVLLAFQSPECALPPVVVTSSEGGAYQYQILNGVHRYYSSVAVGYEFLPVVVRS